jgi:hypothetical protein
MDMRVPDFENDQVGSAADSALQPSADEESRAQEAALERLADRVIAARSVL